MGAGIIFEASRPRYFTAGVCDVPAFPFPSHVGARTGVIFFSSEQLAEKPDFPLELFLGEW